jgi:hypothetical protein
MPSARRDSCARPQKLHERERRGRNEGDASSYFTIVRRGVRFLLFPTLALLFSALPGLPCSFQDRASDQTGAPRDTDDYEPSPDS